MPYAVETSGNGCYGCEEGVGHPDGKDSVLLSDTLSCGDVVFRRLAYAAPDGELCPAAGEGDKRYPHERSERYIAVHDGACGDGNGHGERHGPEIECRVARVLQALREAWHRVAYSPSH